MARMGHDSERAAMIYQHEARGADKAITDAIDKHVDDEQRQGEDGLAIRPGRNPCGGCATNSATQLPQGDKMLP